MAAKEEMLVGALYTAGATLAGTGGYALSNATEWFGLARGIACIGMALGIFIVTRIWKAKAVGPKDT